MGGRDDRLRIIPEEESNGGCAHRAAIASRGSGRACILPRHSSRDSVSRGFGRSTSANDPILREERGDPSGVVCGVELPALHETPGQLSGQLGVVRVLADGEPAAGMAKKSAWTECAFNVGSTLVRWVPFDDEAERVTQGLPDEAACELIHFALERSNVRSQHVWFLGCSERMGAK